MLRCRGFWLCSARTRRATRRHDQLSGLLKTSKHDWSALELLRGWSVFCGSVRPTKSSKYEPTWEDLVGGGGDSVMQMFLSEEARDIGKRQAAGGDKGGVGETGQGVRQLVTTNWQRCVRGWRLEEEEEFRVLSSFISYCPH